MGSGNSNEEAHHCHTPAHRFADSPMAVERYLRRASGHRLLLPVCTFCAVSATLMAY
eukprot:CAMPEP_0119307810 /NCGR_PEP_ID=MMETSP1333-20130426/8199_1 /TAXON_ID=418940 /ORGANISM="Scyphosphaera apsteinii, Strain RCC1455" /LENGTH=56 /DNA_ID=CAMNT_0007311439 /DNA_START=1014 /DNA_END=1184 /DNA_ORIENTATION=-